MEKTWQQLLSPEIAENCTFATTYNKAVELLDKGVTKGVIICIKNVPFEREESIHISAVLPLQERGFYLSTQGNVKNLFLLGESQTIYYTHEFVPHYVRDFNTNVKLEKLGANKISNEDFEISTEKSEHSILLNQQEFIPESGEGVFSDFRQKLMAFHDEETMDVSNLQRLLQKKCADKKLKGIYIQKDGNGHLHGAVAYGDKALQYVTYSQSTSHEFCENFMKNM
jgi:hypothetical protein